MPTNSLLIKKALLICNVLWFHTDVRNDFSLCVKNTIAIFIRIALNLKIALGIMDILTVLIILIP